MGTYQKVAVRKKREVPPSQHLVQSAERFLSEDRRYKPDFTNFFEKNSDIEEEIKKHGRPKYWTEERLQEEAEAFIEWLASDKGCWINQFALERGYNPTNYNIFSKLSESFLEVLKFARKWQEERLIQGALFNKTNANFTKFLLSNLGDWKDRQTIIHKVQSLDDTIKEIEDQKSHEIVVEAIDVTTYGSKKHKVEITDVIDDD